MRIHSFKKDAMIDASANLMVIASVLTAHEDENVIALIRALLDDEKAEVGRLKAVLLQDYSQKEFGIMVKSVVRNRSFVRDLLEKRQEASNPGTTKQKGGSE
jgi:hypothetical protein